MKKISIIVVTTILTMSLIGCSNENESESNEKVSIQQESSIGEGSQRRGGQVKLDMMRSGQGGRKPR